MQGFVNFYESIEIHRIYENNLKSKFYTNNLKKNSFLTEYTFRFVMFLFFRYFNGGVFVNVSFISKHFQALKFLEK